ncbi:hypothetical protein HPB51_019920 [Rhipicephalus microplus]|uniref:Uncharacterized protein n=1 Tax=Rhipicephalus microplus TaxID=6941 RepID=A0A9J6E3L4_RHIMP|nr:hypothetical protein HPB51_019920 [Rhipicephalus microplus]
MGSFHFMLAALAVLGCAVVASAVICKTDADCSGGQRCVLHSNFSSRANCETDHRCISVSSTSCSGPQCGPNQVCGYQRTGLVCIKCPCYGTDRAVCVDKQPGVDCGPNSIVQVNHDNSYVCKACASATSVLTH